MSRGPARRLLAVALALAVVSAAGPAPASAATTVTSDDFEDGAESGYAIFEGDVVAAGKVGSKSARMTNGEEITESIDTDELTIRALVKPDIGDSKTYFEMGFQNGGLAAISWDAQSDILVEYKKSGSATRAFSSAIGSHSRTVWYWAELRFVPSNDSVLAKVWRYGNAEPGYEVAVGIGDTTTDYVKFLSTASNGKFLVDEWTSSLAGPDNQTVTGRITADDGSGIANATISFTNSSLGVNKTISTNGTGHYNITLPNGSYQTTTDATLFVGESGSATVDGTTNVSRSLTHKTRLSATVVNQSGDPVAGATITLDNPNLLDGVIDDQVTTDSGGQATSAFLTPNTYTVAIDKSGYERIDTTVDLLTNVTRTYVLNESGPPYVADPVPAPETYVRDRTVDLSARVSDPNDNSLNASLYVTDGAIPRRVARVTNVSSGYRIAEQVEVPPAGVGWYVVASDGVSTVNSTVFTVQTPGVINVYNQSGISDLSDGTALIQSEESSYRDQRGWSAGQLDLEGVPNERLLIQLSAQGYRNQTIAIDDPARNYSVLLAPKSGGGTADNTTLQGFELDDRSGKFDPGDSRLIVERYYRGSYRYVGSDTFGAANNATVTLVDGRSYRLSVENSDGAIATLGDIIYRPSNFNQPEPLIIRDDAVEEPDDGNQSTNQDPVASIDYSPTAPSAPVDLHLNATGSRDPDGSIVAYQWTVTAGTERTLTGSRPVLELDSGGNITLELTVKDDDGATDTVSEQVLVASSGEPPTPRITVSPDDPDKTDTIILNASKSTDADGSITSYNWTVEPPDNSAAIDRTGETANFSLGSNYPTGTYIVSLTIEDDSGNQESKNEAVYIAKNDSLANTVPNATFTFSPQSPNKSETVTFDGSGSSDPDGSIDSYEWDFDADGAVDANGSTVNHSYPSNGTYDVTLTVTDTNGSEDTRTRTVTVGGGETNASPNEPPTARITVTPGDPAPGEQVTLNASASADPDGNVTRYEWDLDGDGVTDKRGNVTRTSFDSSGSYQVTLTVTDDANTTDTTTTTVTVGTDSSNPGGSGYVWDARLLDPNASDQRATIRFEWHGESGLDVANFSLRIYEQGNESNVLFQRDYGTSTDITLEEVLRGAQVNKTWVVEWSAQVEGQQASGQRILGSAVQNPFDVPSPWRGWAAIAMIWMFGGLFSKANAGIGAVLTSALGGALYLMGWLSGIATGGAVLAALTVGIIWQYGGGPP